MVSGMTIGEVARQSGLSVSAIRFYQRRGLLEPRAAGSGWQRYDGAALTRLALIELAKRTGFSLDDVAVLLTALETAESPAATWRDMFQTKIDDIDDQMQQLHAMRHLLTEAIRCECLDLETADAIPRALGWATQAAATSHTAPMR
jgi:DNA-binding transcriptional MerR regulator